MDIGTRIIKPWFFFKLFKSVFKSLIFLILSISKKIKDKSFNGINVTLPYKQKIIKHIDKIINDAEVTSSVNTLLLDNDNLIIGENTDVFGLQAAYLKELDNSLNKKALVIGAGGVSPSVILSNTAFRRWSSISLS